MREEAVSVALGYTSIACWLGAQFPQILVNWRRQSVDGLSLPFLINWMFGDSTNLIGCLLTDQLPFQTYVAVYFVLVDFSLVAQYFYYDAAKDAKALSALRQRSASAQGRRSSSLVLPLPSSSSLLAQQPHHPYTLPRASLVRSRSASSYSRDPQLRAALAGVSLAAAEAEARHAGEQQQQQPLPWRRTALAGRRAGSLEGLPESVVADSHARYREWAATRRQQPHPGDTDDDGDNEEEAAAFPESPSIMISSFYSEDGGGQAVAGRSNKRVSWSAEGSSGGGGAGGNGQQRRRRRLSYDWQQQPSIATSTTDSRGRQLARASAAAAAEASAAETPSAAAVLEEPLLLQAPEDARPLKRRTSTASTVSAAASRRSAGIVFLGVFALFGLSTTTTTTTTRWRRDGAATAGGRGEVLTASQPPPPPPSHIPHSYDVLNLNLPPGFDHASAAALATATAMPSFLVEKQQQQQEDRVHDDDDVLSSGSDTTKQLIGRISAWTCTTLYITSRLPQIWKNFARKSVEGLSIYLFIFAFLGNFFYVLSILSNPRMDLPAPQAAKFLRASVPYLLGSGGTLMFDVTIVLQSLVYRSRAPRSAHSRSSSSLLFGTKRRGRRKSQSVLSAMEEGEDGDEERAALLGGVGGRVGGGGGGGGV